ncbi:WD40 repeat-like protein [Mycena olivaceomarginata]|nr:WD40 repeat-like protein [Mycena olivaceomarginata]
MSPAPSPMGPKASTSQRLKKFFHLESSQKASASTPTFDSQARVQVGINSLGTDVTSPNVPQFVADVTPNQDPTDLTTTHYSVTPALNPAYQASQPFQNTCQPSALKANAKLAWHGFKLAAKNIPVAILNTIIDTADSVIDNKESMAKVLLPIGQRLGILSNALKSKQPSKGIDRTLERFARQAAEDLQKMQEAGVLKRVLESKEDAKEIDALELNLANFRLINALKDDTEVLRLEKLGPINEVRYATLARKPPVKPCAAGTREEVVDKIISWCKDTSPDVPAVYWLSGMAGTGKTTIAYTVCERLFDDGKASRLGASFFCWRQIDAGRKRGNIIPTLTFQLAHQLPAFRRALLESNVDTNPPPPRSHLDDLIIKMWDASIDDREGLPPLVVVIDALDELEDDEDQNSFLQDLISKIEEHKDHLRGLKFFVTSRRDPRIVEAADSLPPGVIYRLEEVPASTIHGDISTYLQASLPLLPHEQLCRLADHASGLFIYAATAVRFIIPPYISQHPPPFSIQNERLQTLLKGWPNKSRRGAEGLLVDRLYEDILSEYLNHLTEFDRRIPLAVLHTVLSAEEPVLISDIPQLWNEPEMEDDVIADVLQRLHSVLYVSEDSHRVYAYHKSFTDFMFESTRFINQELAGITCPPHDVQFRLAASCFRLMASLRFNICGLPSSFIDDSEITDLPTRINNYIPSSLRYACRHWAAHLSKIPPGTQERRYIIAEINPWLVGKWLFWMEAMNLLNVVGECYHALAALRRWLGSEEITIQKHLIAAESLTTIFASTAMVKSTPHLYLSALAALYKDDDLATTWRDRFPGIPTVDALQNTASALLLLRHDDSVTSVSFSPDGSCAISGSYDKTVSIWDVSTGKQLHHLEGHDGRVTSVRFSPDGSRAISGSSDNTVRIWDSSTGKQLHCLEGHDGPVILVRFSPDGLRAISASDNHSLCTWDVSTGKQLHRLEGHEAPVSSVSFLKDRLCAITDDGTVRTWDVSAGKQLHPLEGHDGAVTSISFSPDGSRAISGSCNTVRIWDVLTGQQLHHLEGHDGRVTSVRFSSDGSRAISGSADHSLCIWHVSTGEQLHHLEGHDDRVTSVRFSPDGLRAISGSSDNTVRIWDSSTGKQLHCLEGHDGPVTSVRFSPDGSRAISGSDDYSLRIWDVLTGEQLRHLEGHEAPVTSVSFSPDGSRAISCSDDETLRIWDVSAGKLHPLEGHKGAKTTPCASGTCQPGKAASSGGARRPSDLVRIWDVSTGRQLHHLEGHDDRVTSVCFSSDGSRAISGSADHSLCIWDVSTGEQLHYLEGHKGRVTSVSFSPNGSRAISGSADRSLHIWDVSTGKQLHILEGHDDSVTSVSFSPDGSCAISGSYDNTLRIWDASTGKQLHRLEGHDGPVTSVRFSPDGSRAISGSGDHSLRIWDVSTGQQLHHLEGHDDPVTSISFSPEGSLVVSGSYDSTVRIWDVSTGKQMYHLEDNDMITSVNFSSDGSRAISGSYDHAVRIWTLSRLDPINAEWHVNADGWITSSGNERRLWLSQGMRHFLQTPQCLLISSRGSVKISFTNAFLGAEWAQCYDD